VTVAAVILAATAASALGDADGVARVRRIADAAWSGGAFPVVVVASDPDGEVAAVLAGSNVTLALPAPVEGGPVAQIRRGIRVAEDAVVETDAALVWPAPHCWVDPETLTSLIEAHGADRSSVLRPAYRGEAGWPVLLPLAHLDRLASLAASRTPPELIADLEAAGVAVRCIELGDPGAVYQAETPRGALPPYDGPPTPQSGQRHEWGARVADSPDDAPLEGPRLAR
jgi:CTP:molybdopterin cytidylyltransferase MocA